MKPFSSSILSVNESASYKEVPVTLKRFKENESALVKLLEFDDAAAQAKLTSSRDYYISLLKLANHEAKSYDPAYNAIFNQYEAVKAAVCSLMNNNYSYSDNNNYMSDLDRIRKLSTEFNFHYSVKIISSLSQKPINTGFESLTLPIKRYCQNALDGLLKGSFDVILMTDHEKFLSNLCLDISKMIGIEESNSLDELITNYKNSFTLSKSDIPGETIASLTSSVVESINSSSIYLGTHDLLEYTNIESVVSTIKANIDSIDINAARIYIKNICDALSVYAIFTIKARDIVEEINKEVVKYNLAAMSSALNANSPVKEGMSMFGDEIDSKGLFDDLDPEDWNPTEFLDISLVTNHIHEMDVIDARCYAMALEAKYLANGEYNKLHTVHEALMGKLKDGLKRIVEAIRNLVKKFTADIMGVFAPEKTYLEKYKNIILNNSLPENTEITFYGDVINGYKRLKGNFRIPTISYNELMANGGRNDFADESTFFDKKFRQPYMQQLKRNTENSLADDVKIYYGFKDGSNGYTMTYSKFISDIGGSGITDIYNWLLDTNKEAKTLDNESKNIERTYNNYVKSAKAYSTNNQNNSQNNNNQNTQTTQNASYYSVLFDKEINISEADIKAADPQPISNNNGNNSNNNNQPQQPKTNTNMTRGDTDAEVKKSGDTEVQIQRNMEIYCKVCQSVISARATAFRYVHKEMMDIIKAIVKAKLGNKAEINKQPEQQQNNDNNTKPDQSGKGNTMSYDYGYANNNKNTKKAPSLKRRK